MVKEIKFSEVLNQDVFSEGQKIGEIEDIYIDPETWEVSHLEIKLTKEAAHEILGARTSINNTLAISALKEGKSCCNEKGLALDVSKAQLHLYLRPVE
jgi:sporulation protein YlmC with PRC-barrel domain